MKIPSILFLTTKILTQSVVSVVSAEQVLSAEMETLTQNPSFKEGLETSFKEALETRIKNSISASRRSVQNVPKVEESILNPKQSSSSRTSKIVNESKDLKEKIKKLWQYFYNKMHRKEESIETALSARS